MISADITEIRPRAAGADRWSAAIRSDGYVAIGHQELEQLVSPAELMAFGGHWNDLEKDGALPDAGTYRYRRYGRLRVEAIDGHYRFTPMPHAIFRQDAAHIPYYQGKERLFAPIPEDLLLDEVLTRLIAADLLTAARLTAANRWIVGLHMIRVLARARLPGKPTPEGRHRDGHDYVGMHLINRRDCSGGESIIYPHGKPPVQLTLSAGLDSLVIDDSAITHEVTAVAAVGPDGVRDTLLVDLNADHGDG